MITTLTIKDPKRLPTPWWSDTPALLDRHRWEFPSGLTILWGPNGCGKSTVLTLLARLLHAEQGGRSTITETSIRALWKRKISFGGQDPHRDMNLDYLLGGEVETDGQAVRYVNPSRPLGLINGHLDDDFFEKGLQAVLAKGSAGQKAGHAVVDLIRDRGSFEVQDHMGYLNEIWAAAKEATTVCLRPTIPKGPPTLLLDEPDLHFDLPSQATLWEQLVRVAKTEQIIAASHSVFAVDVPGATYIDLVPGYLEECRRSVGKLFWRGT